MAVALAASGAVLALPPPPKHNPATTLTRFAFASCNHHDDAQPFWADIAAAAPQLFVWLGDVVYADRKVIWKWRIPADRQYLHSLLTAQRGQPDYAAFAGAIPITGMYDDHDAGQNDADASYELLADGTATREFLAFLDEPPESERSRRMAGGGAGGVYAAYYFGTAPRRVRLLLLDNRTFRQPYDDAVAQDMLGEEQWAWLERELATETAQLTFIGLGLQFVSRSDPWITESWSKMPASQAKLIALLARHNVSGAVLLSGDMHVAEVHRLTCPAVMGYPLYDATASGMTHSWGGWIAGPVWNLLVPAPTRVRGLLYQERHWGEIVIDWGEAEGGADRERQLDEAGGDSASGGTSSEPTVTLRMRGADDGGKVHMEVRLPVLHLSGAGGKAGLAALEAVRCEDPPPAPSSVPSGAAWWRPDTWRNADAARLGDGCMFQGEAHDGVTGVDAAKCELGFQVGGHAEAAAAMARAAWLDACQPGESEAADGRGYPLSANGDGNASLWRAGRRLSGGAGGADEARRGLAAAIVACASSDPAAGYHGCAAVMRMCSPK